jgi:ABC-type sugar transport system ATPase subunit
LTDEQRVGADGCVLALRSVTRLYGATVALNDVTLELKRGSVHGVIGENGAGKSTAAQIATGVVQPTSGLIECDGEPVTFRSAHDAEALGIVLIPQELLLYEYLSIAENLYVGRARPRGPGKIVRHDKMNRRAAEVLRRLQIDASPSERVEQLSPGARQLVTIARALIHEARVLIMDEPTAALDEWETQRLLTIVGTLKEAGVVIMFVSHRLHEVKQIADTITVMRDGSVVAEGAADSFTEAELVRHMVGRPISLLARTTTRATDRVALKTTSLTRSGQFSDVSLEVRAGEVLGMAGLVGSGQSEFAQSLVGYTKPTGGTIEVDGKSVRLRSVRGAIRAGIGYLPEERASQGLFLPLTVRANVSLPALDRVSRAKLIRRKAEQEFVARALQPLQLRGTQSDPVARLSGGNQQKVLLARWIGVGPEVLLLNAPTRGIDVGARAEIYEIIDQLTSKGVAILLISSDIQELLLLSDRIVVMRGGRLVGEFSGDDMPEVNIGAAALGAVDEEREATV